MVVRLSAHNMAQHHPQDHQQDGHGLRISNDGIFAFADAHNVSPATVTQAILKATAFGVEGWDNMADRIKADLNSDKMSAFTHFRWTAGDCKVYLCMKFRHLDGSFRHYDGSFRKPR